MYNLPLFAEPPRFDRDALARKLRALADEGVWIGTSSWKYEGWLGQIYTAERYQTRGKFSEKRFQQECLAEYAEVFPIVCGDFSFYQFPSPYYWSHLFASSPARLRWTLKAPEQLTVKSFPKHARYGARAGEPNPSFLDAELFERLFLDPLTPYRERIAAIVLEFGTFNKSAFAGVREFAGALAPFLAALPNTFRYAVEIRNADFLRPEYFQCLRAHSAAHVLNAWTRMPEIGSQMRIEEAFPAAFTVARALLRRGRPYAEAVERFSPYRAVQDENPETRAALRDLIHRSRDRREPSYIFVNNRLEGNAPATIESLAGD